jgi:hypothetical protein
VIKLKIISIIVAFFIFPVASVFGASSPCIKQGVVVVEVVRDTADGDPDTIINGRLARHGEELSMIRESCGKYMVVLLSPKSTMRDFINFGFLAAKSDFYESSEKYLPFAYSSDKTRMTYLKNMVVVRFSKDPEQLEKIAKSPPTKSNFL